MSTRTYRGHTHSYNGWPFVTSSALARAVVPGTGDVRIEILAGPVATVLNAWAALWHKNIRRIDVFRPRDYWGWSAVNDHPTSNHLSGTAIDLNATTLPFRQRTMPADQRARVDQMVRDFRGVVAWGGHWTNPSDEMHAEIAVRPGDHRLTTLARDLSSGYLSVPWGGATTEPIGLRRGDSGPAVLALQKRLNRDYPRYSELVEDGIFGPHTESVISEFQLRSHLPVTGVATPEVIKRLGLS